MSDRTKRVSFEDYPGTDTFRTILPPPPPISEYLFKDLPPSASPREVVHRVAQVADTADFARVNQITRPRIRSSLMIKPGAVSMRRGQILLPQPHCDQQE